MTKTTTICDGCEKEEQDFNTKGWIQAGEWFLGHPSPRLEIYFSGYEEADPDLRLHFCELKCLTTWLEKKLATS